MHVEKTTGQKDFRSVVEKHFYNEVIKPLVEKGIIIKYGYEERKFIWDNYHYTPDFIIRTKNNLVIIVETKARDFNQSQSNMQGKALDGSQNNGTKYENRDSSQAIKYDNFKNIIRQKEGHMYLIAARTGTKNPFTGKFEDREFVLMRDVTKKEKGEKYLSLPSLIESYDKLFN